MHHDGSVWRQQCAYSTRRAQSPYIQAPATIIASRMCVRSASAGTTPPTPLAVPAAAPRSASTRRPRGSAQLAPRRAAVVASRETPCHYLPPFAEFGATQCRSPKTRKMCVSGAAPKATHSPLPLPTAPPAAVGARAHPRSTPPLHWHVSAQAHPYFRAVAPLRTSSP
ncbi:hypothetical protein HYPSUDRAFT_199981 [Hypholoma sublateritium FD-334 SS-4]|uniref:Uncharacterized protein n=1 Tax=Hypholoma sublateritium (strain FD-334 SS-4) TaxID=945553 RepID=A0A0D2P8Y4_HYPSF|nr:hypothetical protein HYPSUDRAFT_199981 [Hypholoma sublateritium FD-334 SS-4]